jgi:hypothetical protein
LLSATQVHPDNLNSTNIMKKPAKTKSKKPQVKVRDLKPAKDQKGGGTGGGGGAGRNYIG